MRSNVKIAGLLIFCCSLAWAGKAMLSTFGHSNSYNATVTIPSAGAGISNCLTDLDVVSDAQYTFQILDGASVIYSVVVSSGGAIVRSWADPFPMCGSPATQMQLTVVGGNYNINYAGYTAR